MTKKRMTAKDHEAKRMELRPYWQPGDRPEPRCMSCRFRLNWDNVSVQRFRCTYCYERWAESTTAMLNSLASGRKPK